MRNIRFATPDISRLETENIKKTVDTRWITAGPTVHLFEHRIAEMSGCDKAVCFDSCTGAMEMTLRALGIGPGDEVITTPYTYSATAEVIRNVGATIVFVDLAPDSFEMDYWKVADAITPQTKAVMPVDIGGKLCNYDALYEAIGRRQAVFHPSNEIQRAFNRVIVVADAAHSFGADWDGFVTGQLADFTCYSFHVLKNVTTGGEGGAVVWDSSLYDFDSEAFEEHLRLLGDHGQTSRDKSNGWEYDIALFGYNSIMTDVDAAMGLAQLDRFEEIKQKRIDVTTTYDALFDELNEHGFVIRPMIRHFGMNYTSAMHLYPVQLPESTSVRFVQFRDEAQEIYRNAVWRYMKDAGVPCNVHYKPLPMMTAYKQAGFDIKDYPNAYKTYASLLTIPYHTELTEEEQRYIVSKLKEAVMEL